MSQKVSKKIKAYQLFAQGYEPKSPQVKALKLKYGTVQTYYCSWKSEGSPFPSPPPEEKAADKSKVKPKIIKGKIPLPGGESIRPLTELELVPPKVESDELSVELGEPKVEGSEEKPSGEKVVVPSDGKKQQPKSILAEGLTVTVNISPKTLMLYDLACSMQDGELTLGDFIDVCVEDTYRGRGVDLGLVKIGGK